MIASSLQKNVQLLMLLLPLYSIASDTTAKSKEASKVDTFHQYISNTVLTWAKRLDNTFYHTLEDSNKSGENSDALDAFFQTTKYIQQTEDTYMRLHIGANMQSRESDAMKLRLSAQLPLDQSMKHFKLFMNNIEVNNLLNPSLTKESMDSDLGINYDAVEVRHIKSKYSIGFSDITPYIRARYSLLRKTKSWDIDTVQSFQYASRNIFKEETNIYFDHYYDKTAFFRLQLQRKTQTDMDGMDYGFIFQYYYTPNQTTGVLSTAALLGNTEYRFPQESKTHSYAGIHNYLFSLLWRENIWRKWFFYTLSPAVNFHKSYAYKANYSFSLKFDFYFGEHH